MKVSKESDLQRRPPIFLFQSEEASKITWTEAQDLRLLDLLKRQNDAGLMKGSGCLKRNGWQHVESECLRLYGVCDVELLQDRYYEVCIANS